ncbi:Rox3 mediator complex subunit-domain-containing protein [Aspergillus unguis]
MSNRTSAPFRTGPPSPSPSSPAPFTSIKDSTTPTIPPEQTPQTPTSPPLMSVSAPNNASTFASLQALPSQATSQSATLSSPPSSAPMSTQTSQQPTAGVTNSFPTPASSFDPDHIDKSFGTGFSETGASSAAATSTAPIQQSEHRRTDHNRDTEPTQAGTGVQDFASMSGDSAQPAHGDAMELDTETPSQTNASYPSLDSLQKDFSSAFHLCKSSHIATGPDPSVDLISLYGLGPVAKSVARNDPVTGEKINRLRKSYEGKLKGLGLAGRNKPVKHDPSTPGGLRQMTMWPEEEWQNQKVFGKEIKVADMDSALYNLQMKAMKMEPGMVPNNDYWEDVLGHDKPAKNPNVGDAAKKSSTPSATARTVTQSNGTPMPAESERSRPSRGRKRHYDDNSFVGYGEGFADDDDDSAFYSNGEGGGKKKRKKDHVPRMPGPPERGGSYGVGMFGIGAR